MQFVVSYIPAGCTSQGLVTIYQCPLDSPKTLVSISRGCRGIFKPSVDVAMGSEWLIKTSSMHEFVFLRMPKTRCIRSYIPVR